MNVQKVSKEEFDLLIEDIPSENCHETGSWFTCNPPVTDTDEDWVFDCSYGNQYEDAAEYLKAHGFKKSGLREDKYDEIDENFMSFRKGQLNFILCNKLSFYKKFILATMIAKNINLLEKEHRIVLFQAILYGKFKGEEWI